MAAEAEWTGAGFHGKLPIRGDFVTRNLPAPVVEVLDGWLQDGIAASRDRLGTGWLDLYLTSPIWHFALDAGIAGSSALTGLMIPSVDQVGRYFPLLVLGPLAGTGNLFEGALRHRSWRERAEKAALLALDEGVALDRFEREVAALGAPDGGAPDGGTPVGGAGTTLLEAAAGLAEETLRARHGERISLWWTEGSERVTPALLAAAGLPPAGLFNSLLNGEWARLDGLAVSVRPLGVQA
ncbi:hypothetical protein [Azospirillum argentinense]|uniref:type VI secretion system-associated protein TagF n=1 Tax=Azospirillum argentinense TaxID=2970906 RepID=UPI0032DF77D0